MVLLGSHGDCYAGDPVRCSHLDHALFNRFSPLEDGELRHAITDYARGIGFALDNIFVMDGSRRSTKSNAFFTGFGRHRRIVLFDTLIEKHSPEELVAVLAHEMGHLSSDIFLK